MKRYHDEARSIKERERQRLHHSANDVFTNFAVYLSEINQLTRNIKLMQHKMNLISLSLPHVSEPLFVILRRGTQYNIHDVMKSFFPRLIDRCRAKERPCPYKPVGQFGLTLIGCLLCCLDVLLAGIFSALHFGII